LEDVKLEELHYYETKHVNFSLTSMEHNYFKPLNCDGTKGYGKENDHMM